jgi:DNA repair protein RecO (recombination protein O)
MLVRTKGILLHSIRYGDNQLIVTLYTEQFGRQVFIVQSATGKKSRNKTSVLQPLFLIDLVAYYKPSREIQRIKEFTTYETFRSIPFEIKKSTQVLFLAEILYKLLREEESNPALYRFCEEALLYLDHSKQGLVNFHLFFLARLTGFLGILPHIHLSGAGSWLDLRTGISTSVEPAHSEVMNLYETQLFRQLTGISLRDLPEFTINRETREILLRKMITYYQHHFDALGEIKSLAVLKEVFFPG